MNEEGGLLGREVEFVIHDDGSDPEAANALYERLVTEEGMDPVMGPYGSTLTEAVAPVTEAHRQVLLSPMAASALGDFIVVVRQMRDLDVNVRMFGTSGAVDEFRDALGEAAEYAYGLSAWEPSLPNPGVEDFVRSYSGRTAGRWWSGPTISPPPSPGFRRRRGGSGRTEPSP